MSGTHTLFRFGVFELNLTTEELRKDGVLVKLAPQPFRILVLLASHAGQVVTREEIQKQIWGEETYVDFEHGMNQRIKQIRTALNDNPDNPLYVETLPRQGYRFLAPVVSKTVAAPEPRVTEAASSLRVQVGANGASAAAVKPELSTGKTLPRDTEPAQPTVLHRPPARDLTAPTTGVEVSRHRVQPLVLGVAATVVLVASLAGWRYWRSHQAAFREKDSIVLADFANTTGDTVFDDALKQALTIQLEQTPFLNVVSDRRVNQTLKLMDRPNGERVTLEVAREVCLRTGSKAFLAGSIAPIGDRYLITLKAVNCQTGDTLASSEKEAENQDLVIKRLEQASNQLRGKLGESLASMQRFNQPLDEATTSSLAALQAYSQARRMQLMGSASDAIPYLQRAVELDPNFALAYLALAITYGNRGETGLAMQNNQIAYDLRDRVSERERFAIEAQYYGDGTRELEKAIQTYSAWNQSYPGDYQAHNNLGVMYMRLGLFEKAAAEMRESVSLIPGNAIANHDLIDNYVFLDRFDEAQNALQDAIARNLDGPDLRVSRYLLAFLHGDAIAMQQQVDWAMGKSGAEDWLLALQSDTEAYYGHLEAARALSQQAVQLAKRAVAPETAAQWEAAQALREAEIGDAGRARQTAADALALSSGRDVAVVAALALARAGDAGHTRQMVEKLSQESPLDTIMQEYSLPTIRAALELNANQPGKAIEELEVVRPYELGLGPFAHLYPAYLRGLAYLDSGQDQSAVTEFQKILDHRGIVGNAILGSLAHLQLARAYVLAGDKTRAKVAYQDFLSTWKNADPGIAVLQQAKTEYAQLQSSSSGPGFPASVPRT